MPLLMYWYLSNDKKDKGRNIYVYIYCFAWDNLNSSGKGSKSGSKWIQKNIYETKEYVVYKGNSSNHMGKNAEMS